MDPKKMAAFAGPAPDAGAGDAIESDAGQPDQAGGEDTASRFEGVVPALMEHANELEEAGEELASTGLDPMEVMTPDYEPDDAAIESISDAYDNFDDGLAEALTQIAGATPDECRDLAQQLADDGAIQDVDAVAAVLVMIAQHVLHAEPGDEGEGGDSGDDEGDMEGADINDGGDFPPE